MEPGESFDMVHNGRDINIRFICRSPTSEKDGMCDVIFEVMGLPRIVRVVDKSQADSGKRNARADAGNAKHLGSPMPGQILNYRVAVGDTVAKGDPLLSLTAMKMETVVVATVSGKIASITLAAGDNVQGGDRLLTFE
jgi:pyruvate carboxylase